MLNKRFIAVLILGFYSGLPIALTGTTLQAWFADSGLSLMSIGLLSFVGLPYLYKFAWSPFIDRFNLLHFLPITRFKAWMVVSQLCLTLCMFSLAFLSPQNKAVTIAMIVLALAFFSATQDCVIDAFRTELLPPDERGMGAAYHVFSYRVAMLVSGGLALIIAGFFGWKVMFLLLSGLMSLAMVLTLLVTDVGHFDRPKLSFKACVIEPWRSFIQRDSGLLLLLFLLFYKFGDAFAQALLSVFFIQELHFTLAELGSIYKVVGLISAVLGAFLGGVLLPRLKMYHCLLYFGLLQAIANLFFIVPTLVANVYPYAVAAVMFENITAGITSTVYVAFMMSLCDRRYTATQFALMTAIAAVGRVVVGPLAAVVVGGFGWAIFFVVSFVIVLPSLWLLKVLHQRININQVGKR